MRFSSCFVRRKAAGRDSGEVWAWSPGLDVAISRRKGAHGGMGTPAQHIRTQKKEKQTISIGIGKEERPVTFFT